MQRSGWRATIAGMLGGRGRDRDRSERQLAPAQRLVLAQRLPWWHVLTTAERLDLESLTVAFLATKDVEAARGFELDDEMPLLIAAQAALPLVGLAAALGSATALDQYRDVSTVVVHPTTVVQSHERPTATPRVMTTAPEHLLGQAQLHGPVLLAWDSVEESLQFPGRGRNVVFHEFAHKLDMRDGRVDGTPLLGDRTTRKRWHDLATQEMASLRRRPDPVLRRYGAQNPAEFFAVAVEAFLDDPITLWREKPDFYDVLRELFRQDPAARLLRLLPTTV